jgi:aminoglycoside 3-N-acetyltransferase
MLARVARPDARDVRLIHQIWSDPRVMAPVGFPEGLGLELEDVRRELEEQPGRLIGSVLLVETSDGAFVGQARMGPLDDELVSETDLKLLPEYQRQGLALELKKAMLEFLFCHSRCECVRSMPRKENLASIALQDCVGALRVGEGHWREKPEDDGFEHWIYELTRERWKIVSRGGEAHAILRSESPQTRDSIAELLRELGVAEGDLLLVHSSLSALGWVVGGELAVVQALLDVLGEEGTLVVPTHSADNTDPSAWENPPVPREWWTVIRDHMPAFDPANTPSRWMGRIAECVRTWPGALRSEHPNGSFAAIGPLAEGLLRGPALVAPFGEDAPLARLYEMDADVLLLGVGYDSHTSFHLAEHRAGVRSIETVHGAVFEDGERVWGSYEEPRYDSSSFAEIGRDFEQRHAVQRLCCGRADARLFAMRPSVDFAVNWLLRAD